MFRIWPVLFRLLGLGVGLLLMAGLWSCVEDRPKPTYRRPPIYYFRSDFRIEVQPPGGEPGPNYLVHFYLDPDDFNARRPFRSAVTDSTGIASFVDIRAGEGYVDCTIPGPVPAYDSTFVVVFGDTNAIVLRPQ